MNAIFCKNRFLTLCVALLWVFVAGCQAIPPRMVFGTANTKEMLATSLSIRVYTNVHTDDFGDSVWSLSYGSGFLASAENCEIWTNQHVVEDAAKVEILPYGSGWDSWISARVVNSTLSGDMAVLYADNCEGVKESRLGDSNAVKAGDEVYTVGNPAGFNTSSMSYGIVSSVTRSLSVYPVAYIQVDATLNPGNSGGPLFDKSGRVIGVVERIIRHETGNVGVAYAIPINYARKLAKQLKLSSVYDTDIGRIVGRLNSEEAEIVLGFKSHSVVIVARTPAGGSALGKLQVRDVILAVDGRPVDSVNRIVELFANHKDSDNVTLTVVREGKRISVVLASEGSGVAKKQAVKTSEPYSGRLGMTLDMPDETMFRDTDMERARHPMITGVQNLGPAHLAGIKSSQHNVFVRGPFMMIYQQDVKLVTGVFYGGAYTPIDKPELLEQIASLAYARGEAILLEVELWERDSPVKLMENTGRAYIRLVPSEAKTHAR